MKKILIILLIVFVGIIVFIAWPQSGPSFRLVSYYQTDVGYPETTGTRRVQSIYVNNFEDTPEVWETIEKYAKKLTWLKEMLILFFSLRIKKILQMLPPQQQNSLMLNMKNTA